MKLLSRQSALFVAVSALAMAQPAAAEIVHLKMTGTFTIGDRRNEDFLVELQYDTDARPSGNVGSTTTFLAAGDIFRFTIGDRRDFLQVLTISDVPNYVATVYDLAPPRAVVDQTANGRRVTFTDPTNSIGGVSFFFDTTSGSTLLERLPTFDELALFSGGEVTFGNSRGTFTYSRFTSGVPEPATWGMMILGFGAVGAAMRMRRRKVSVTYA
ncbi:MAG: PEPxxWA-CTERM sorting domain-containing protein [Pseudomonadota bacterium]